MSAINDYLDLNQTPKTKRPGVWWVRLHPYEPQSGHKMRRVTLRRHGLTLREPKGWYQLTTNNGELLERLRRLRDETGNPTTLPACNICTCEEAKEMDRLARERKKSKRRTRADADDPNVLRTTDLPSSRASRRNSSRDAASARADEREGDRAVKAERRQESLSTLAGGLDAAAGTIDAFDAELDAAAAELEERRQALAERRETARQREAELSAEAVRITAEEAAAGPAAENVDGDPWEQPPE